MTDEILVSEVPEPAVELGPPVSIESRFLFVDVAALRAKQLRRGALPRLQAEADADADAARPDLPKKPERIAMEEVRRGVVRPIMPDPKLLSVQGRS